jgi:hypothetical protein
MTLLRELYSAKVDKFELTYGEVADNPVLRELALLFVQSARRTPIVISAGLGRGQML